MNGLKRSVSAPLLQKSSNKRSKKSPEPTARKSSASAAAGVDVNDGPEFHLMQNRTKIEKTFDEVREVQLLRERSRLLDSKTIPLTKSGTKLVCLGIDPINGNEVSLRILHGAHGVSFINFNISEFAELLEVLPQVLGNIYSMQKDAPEVLLAKLRNYEISLLPWEVVKFKPVSQIRSMKTCEYVCLAKETVNHLFMWGGVFLREMEEFCRLKNQGEYFDFQTFAEDVGREIGVAPQESLFQDTYDEAAFKVVKQKYFSNLQALELYLKFTYHVRHVIENLKDDENI